VVAVDPLASLRIAPCVTTIAGHDFVIEGHCAADWITMILGGTLHQVIPGWFQAEDDELILTNMILDGDVTNEELNTITLEVMGIAAGRAAWWAINLIGMVASDNSVWATINGRLLLGGVRADEVSLAAWIDACYSCIVDSIDDKDQRFQFDSQVETPPPDMAIDEEEEGAAFMALMGSGFPGEE